MNPDFELWAGGPRIGNISHAAAEGAVFALVGAWVCGPWCAVLGLAAGYYLGWRRVA